MGQTEADLFRDGCPRLVGASLLGANVGVGKAEQVVQQLGCARREGEEE